MGKVKEEERRKEKMRKVKIGNSVFLFKEEALTGVLITGEEVIFLLKEAPYEVAIPLDVGQQLSTSSVEKEIEECLQLRN